MSYFSPRRRTFQVKQRVPKWSSENNFPSNFGRKPTPHRLRWGWGQVSRCFCGTSADAETQKRRNAGKKTETAEEGSQQPEKFRRRGAAYKGPASAVSLKGQKPRLNLSRKLFAVKTLKLFAVKNIKLFTTYRQKNIDRLTCVTSTKG